MGGRPSSSLEVPAAAMMLLLVSGQQGKKERRLVCVVLGRRGGNVGNNKTTDVFGATGWHKAVQGEVDCVCVSFVLVTSKKCIR